MVFSVQKIPNQVIGLITVTNQARAWPIFSNHARAPWLTQKRVRKVKAAYVDVTLYGGYRDDEDQGQCGELWAF